MQLLFIIRRCACIAPVLHKCSPLKQKRSSRVVYLSISANPIARSDPSAVVSGDHSSWVAFAWPSRVRMTTSSKCSPWASKYFDEIMSRSTAYATRRFRTRVGRIVAPGLSRMHVLAVQCCEGSRYAVHHLRAVERAWCIRYAMHMYDIPK